MFIFSKVERAKYFIMSHYFKKLAHCIGRELFLSDYHGKVIEVAFEMGGERTILWFLVVR